MSQWEDVDHLDEYRVNLIQLFNKEKNELLVVTEECDSDIEFIHLKVTPEYENDKLIYIEDIEDIERLSFNKDESYKAFYRLIEILIK